jgi:hypothetical protein
MSGKRLSLNLVLKKKGSLHAFQSAHRTSVSVKEERTEKASEKASFLTLEMAETPISTESYSIPPDVTATVQPSGGVNVGPTERKKDIFTPWGWYSRLSEADKRRWEERNSVQSPSTPEVPPWPCRHCGKPAEVEAVEPSLDGTRTLTLWHCEPCQMWAVTPSTQRDPPVWVARRKQ